jgi:hypothetical protein
LKGTQRLFWGSFGNLCEGRANCGRESHDQVFQALARRVRESFELGFHIDLPDKERSKDGMVGFGEDCFRLTARWFGGWCGTLRRCGR